MGRRKKRDPSHNEIEKRSAEVRSHWDEQRLTIARWDGNPRWEVPVVLIDDHDVRLVEALLLNEER